MCTWPRGERLLYTHDTVLVYTAFWIVVSCRSTHGHTNHISHSHTTLTVVGCNLTFAKNERSGASHKPGFVLLQKYCSPIRLQYFKFSRRSGYMHYANYYITYTSIHTGNYYITVQNKSGYRAGTRPFVFREGRVTPDYTDCTYWVSVSTLVSQARL